MKKHAEQQVASTEQHSNSQTSSITDNRASTSRQTNTAGQILTSPRSIAQRHQTGRLANKPNTATIAQREKVAPAQIAEGQWAHAPSGETLHFTALAAGCLAVVTEFADGGGAGVHLAMLMDPGAQWGQFRNAVAGKSISAVHLYSDMIGEADGWYVKYQGGSPATEISPHSAWKLLDVNNKSLNGDNDWVYSAALVQAWFAAALGAGVNRTVTSGAVDHRCP